MEELKRRDFAKQTLKWGGGALGLLAAVNTPKAAWGGGPPKMGNPLKALENNAFLQRDDLADALKSFYMTYDSTSPYPHKFNDVISKGQLECLELIVSKGLEKEYVEHNVNTMKPILMRVKKMVRRQNGNSIETTNYIDGIFEHHLWGGAPDEQNNHLHVMDDQQRIALVRVGSAQPSDEGPQSVFGLNPSDVGIAASNCQIGGCEPGDPFEIYFIDGLGHLPQWENAAFGDPNRTINIYPPSGAR